ncbi:MAG: type II toxin-antitoxin system Phd/YefM family antitoxin [Synergistaceae bacterium]|nr:type II toxin-antitoxin system Phd/YefM family antitoxin [Synergistaceae bacterium]
MIYTSLKEAKERLYEFVMLLEDGEENYVVITRKGRPVAKIVEYYSHETDTPRKLGIGKGKFNFSPANQAEYDAIDEEVAKQMLEGALFPDEVSN